MSRRCCVDHGRGDAALAEGQVGGGHHAQRDRLALVVGGGPRISSIAWAKV